MWEIAQSRFAAALIAGERSVPFGKATTGASVAGRFAIYRNNFTTGLSDALAVRFPVTQSLVGEPFFAAMAQEFASRRPPASPVLLEYGEEFAEFVQLFEPAKELAYLPDIVRLENACVRAYHARDVQPLTQRELSEIAAEQVPELVFELHPSAALVCSKHPIVTIWEMNSGKAELAPIADWRPEDALVVRPELSVHVHRLPPGGAVFVERLFVGETLGGAAAAAMTQQTRFDLPACVAAVLNAGAFTSIRNHIGGAR